MAKALSLMLAQLNLTVGAIEDNCDKVLAAAALADQQGADLLVCSELALTGYPPEDLLLRADLMIRVEAALSRIAAWQGQCAILVGHPWREEGRFTIRRLSMSAVNCGHVISNRTCPTTGCSTRSATSLRRPIPVWCRSVAISWVCSSAKISGSRVGAGRQGGGAELLLTINASPL